MGHENCPGFGSDGDDGISDSVARGNQRKEILMWERERQQRYRIVERPAEVERLAQWFD